MFVPIVARHKLSSKTDESSIVITGNFNGYLAPCGCSKPMSGGLKRLVSAIKTIENQRATLVLVNGNLGGVGAKRQDQLKVEAISEALKPLKLVAINPGLNDARLGLSAFLAIQQLSNQKLLLSDIVSSALQSKTELGFKGLKVLGVRAENSRIRSLVSTSSLPTVLPNIANSQVVLLDGNLGQATDLAKKNPILKLIIYNSESTSTLPTKIGKVWLVSPGSQGKKFIEIRVKNSVFSSYSVVELSPEIQDDKLTTKIYQDYLRRVTSEKLLEMMPRVSTDLYSGSKSCQPCHSEAYSKWTTTAHGSALATLEKLHHDKDPDCVSCHVVGLESKTGYMSRAKTPDLANVGCESCHGSAKAHAIEPLKVKTTKDASQACMSCHNPNHSPKFDYASFWLKIKH